MVFNHKLIVHNDYVVLTDEITKLEIRILYADIQRVRLLLLDAHRMQQAFAETSVSLEELQEFLTGEAKVFIGTLLEMGIVIPIQKQQTGAK